MAQNIQVKGLVKDPAGEAIIGASVVVKGTTNGSITDLDGKFSLSDVPSGATITVSYIGYISQEKKASATPMEFILKEDTKTLDEIVVVGYGTTKKSSISGAVASVKADELPTAASASVGSMLRGRSSGMNITQNSANPGGSMNISIRGGLSGQSPLIVIDGVPQLSTKTVTAGTAYSGGEKDNALINLNPNDIETIDILKDASAAAIYGSDASGGVILITTKRGKTGTTTYNGNVVSTYEPNGMKANPDLKWETTTSRNIGFDFGLWGSRLSGTLDLYWNTTSDLLMRQEIDSSTGYSYQYRNIGQTSNKGVELALNYHLIRTKDFNLNVSATYNFNKNNIDELDGGKDIYYNSGWGSSAQHPSYDYVLSEGKPVGVIRGFKSAGFYTVDDFDYVDGVYKLKAGIPDISTAATGTYRRPSELQVADGQIAFPGALKLQDVDKSGIVDLDDVVDLGEVQAKHTGGFSLNGNYKNIDFGANFTYQIGGKVYNVATMSQLSGGKETGLGLNKYKDLAGAFQLYDIQNGNLVPVIEPTALKQLNANAKYALPYYEDAPILSDYVEDASYLRLNTLTVGYTLPKAWTTKAYMQKVRIYVTGGNLFCITGYSGLDPEVNSDPDKAKSYPTLGLDWGAYMRARTFTVGLNVEF